jgi:THO complex subunit 2
MIDGAFLTISSILTCLCCIIEDGVNVSQWLQSLEAFSGAFFKRYPSIEFRGIISYLMRRLREGHVMELGILSSLLKVAGGYGFADYSPAASLSVAQLEGRAGSFSLKRQTMTFGIVEDMNVRATETIKKVLQSDGLGVVMLVLIAQARARIIFESTKGPPKPVKLIGNLVDTCQIVISVLLEFLTTEEHDGDGSRTAVEEYAKYLPPLDDLHIRFGLDVECSWMLTRPLVRSVAQNKRTFDLGHALRRKYECMLPKEAWTNLSPALFETFYTFSLYDVFWPEDVYNSELGRLGKEIERLERPKPGAPTGTVQTATSSLKDENQELVRLKSVLETLTGDKEKHQDQVRAVRDELEERKHDLFHSEVSSHEASKALLIHCVYPRNLQSPDDAMYCAHFALQLHHIKTPGFSTLHYIDELVSLAAGSLYGVTEAEAANLAITLWQTWSVINRWRYEDGLFDEEVAGKPGSFMEQVTDEGSMEEREISHKDFIVLYNSWHAALGAALVGSLESKEYMHTRSGLVVMTRLVDVFPTRPKLGNFFLSTLEPLQDENSDRPDIRAAANAYSTMLLKARDDGKWKEEDASVAQARADKEKMAAEERKKKLEEQFEELQRDSEKITEEIGPERRREGRGFGGRGPAAPDRGRVGPPHELREVRDRRSPPREVDRRRDRDGDRGGDRGPPPTRNGDRRGGDRGGRREGLEEGRWVRADAAPSTDDRGTRTSKRGRGSSPDGPTEDRGNSKRARLEPEITFVEPRRDGRGSPPPSRRERGGPDPSRSSRQGRRR